MGSLTRCGFSHEAEPLVVIVAIAPYSAETARSVSSTVSSRSVRSSPSSAQKRST